MDAAGAAHAGAAHRRAERVGLTQKSGFEKLRTAGKLGWTIASQIFASLADEEAWKTRFAETRDVIRRMAREALEEDERGETLPLDDLL